MFVLFSSFTHFFIKAHVVCTLQQTLELFILLFAFDISGVGLVGY